MTRDSEATATQAMDRQGGRLPRNRRTAALGVVWAAALLGAAIPSAASAQTATSQVRSTVTSAPTYVRTVGATGLAQMYPSGLAVDVFGNIAVADTGNDQVKFYAAHAAVPSWTVGVRGAPIGGGTDSFQNPRDVAVDANFVYVADTDKNIVQVLDKVTGSYVRTVPFGFNTPIGVSVGSDGAGHERILVSGGVSGNVDLFDTSDQHLLTIPPTTSSSGTRDAATDSHGNIYTADYRNNRVNKYSPTGTLLLQWGGTSAPLCQQVPKPYGVDVDAADHVYVASSDAEQIKEFNADGTCVQAIGTKGTGSGQLFQLRRVVVGPGANPLVYAADLWGLKILTYNNNGTLSNTQPQLGNGVFPPAGGLNEAHTVAVTSQYVYVADTINQRMQRFNLDGSNPITWGTKGVAETTASFNWAQGIGVNPTSGNVWVANTRNNRLDEFAPDGTGPLRSVGQRIGGGSATFNWPMAVTFDPAGTMFVADTYNNDIQAFAVTPTSVTLLWKVGTGGAGVGQFKHPFDAAYDGTGTTKRVLVTDTTNNRIVALDAATGGWLGVLPIAKGAQPGQVKGPQGIVVAANGSLWVADTDNNRVEMFTNGGTFANELVGSYGLGTNQFNAPQGIQLGADGLLYVADAYNNRVQVYRPV